MKKKKATTLVQAPVCQPVTAQAGVVEMALLTFGPVTLGVVLIHVHNEIPHIIYDLLLLFIPIATTEYRDYWLMNESSPYVPDPRSTYRQVIDAQG